MAVGIHCVQVVQTIFVLGIHIYGESVQMLTLWEEWGDVGCDWTEIYVKRL